MKQPTLNSMSGRDVKVLLEQIVDMFDQGGYGPIILDKEISMRHGHTSGIGSIDYYVIGTKELDENPDKHFPIGKAMVPVVGLFHEVCGHGEQVRHVYKESGPLPQVLALNYYACKNSLEYYNGQSSDSSPRYRKQPHEVAAQYMGLKSARKYLQAIYGDAADGMLLSYVNERRKWNSEFIWSALPYKDLDDVLEKFETAFCDCVDRHRIYSGKRAGSDILHRSPYVREDGIKFVETCSSGLYQDMFITSIYLFECDHNDILRRSGPFKDLKLFPSNIMEAFQTGAPPPRYSKEDLALSTLGGTLDRIEMQRRVDGANDGLDGPE